MEPPVDIVLRSLAVYLFIVIAIRLFGKKELAQLSVIDLVFILLISNSVQNAMVGPDSSLAGGLIAATVLFGANFLLKNLLYRNPDINRLVSGDPVMLVHQGNVIEETRRREKVTRDELEAAAREHGVASIKDVDLAILERDGNISILSSNYTHRSRRRRVHKSMLKQDN